MKTVLMLLGDSPGMYVPLMHGLASKLHDKGYTVVAAATTPFYESFTGVNFSEIGEVHYLSDFLKTDIGPDQLAEVNINYWHVYPTFVRDNYFFGRHRNDWTTYQKAELFFNQIFDRHSIDLVVSEPPSNSFLYLAYSNAIKAGAQFAGFMSARVPSKINVFLDPFGERMLTNKSVESEAESLTDAPLNYMTAREAKFIRGTGIKQVLSFIKYSMLKSFETNRTPLLQLRALYKKAVWRRLRYLRIKLASPFTKDIPSDQNINILFPLHLRPEASTSVLSKYYEDDIELIKNISFSLPSNTRLIIKEHQPALGIRSLNFYRKVLSFPGTVLLDPEYNLAANITRFDAAIVLTSTAGFEAVRAGVPVFLLGRTFYSTCPGITKIESFSQLEKEVRRVSKVPIISREKEIMSAYLLKCFPGRFNYMNDDVASEENVEKLLVPLLQMLDGV